MAIYINEFRVESFRGIRRLNITELNHINIIVGNNNCGKTSVLESMLFLRNPKDLANVLRIARQRDSVSTFSRISVYENFINLFPQDIQDYEIMISSVFKNKQIEFSISGEQKQVLLDEIELNNQLSLFSTGNKNSDIITNTETMAFEGVMRCRIGSRSYLEHIRLHEFSRIYGMEIKKDIFLDMVYLSPIDHVKNSILNHIIRNEDYKEICLHVIQLFDSDIVDLLLLKNEQTNRPIEYIKHRVLGNMPISTYGDGIKKVLLLANAVAQAAGGVLLIDEVETAIHAKYYDDIFRFLVKACLQYQVQVFMTTHNIEAVDALLSTQDYDNQNKRDDISVVTLKKDPDRTYSRVLTGRKVHENREAFDFEVRL